MTIIIVTYERGDDLRLLLENLKDQINYENIIQEIIIINNGTERTYLWMNDFIQNEKTLKIKYLVLDKNLGVSKGRKLGIEKANSEILVFIDDDAIFENKETKNF